MGKKISSTNIEHQRALHLAKLTNEIHFNKVINAIKKDDKAKFLEVCQGAEIPDEISNHIWDLVIQLGYNKSKGKTFPTGMIW